MMKIKKIFSSLFSGSKEESPKTKPASAPQAPSKKTTKFDIYSPFTGTVVARKDIPDEGFSEGYMGEGVGIEPSSGEAVAFMDGELVVLYKTKHAYFIKDSATEISVMLHIGVDTVSIPEDKGAFSTTRKVNETLKHGDSLCNANLEVIKSEKRSIVSALLVQNENMDGMKVVMHKNPGDSVSAGDLLMSVVPA